jgi:hypothetical protein
VADLLCGSTPMTTGGVGVFSSVVSGIGGRGGQRFFELGRPLLSHNPGRGVPSGRTP